MDMNQTALSLRPKPTYPTHLRPNNQTALVDSGALNHGFATARQEVAPGHPLEQSEKKYVQSQYGMQLQMARNAQGLHAPYRLKTEWAMASKIQRLAPLESSFASLETLLGSDETISFDDTLGDRSFAEKEPDAMAMMRVRLGKF